MCGSATTGSTCRQASAPEPVARRPSDIQCTGRTQVEQEIGCTAETVWRTRCRSSRNLELDTSTAQGRELVFSIEAVAKLDRERRSKAVRTSARPPAPIGWRYIGGKGSRRLIVDERERQDCLDIVRLHDVGAMSFDQIWLSSDRHKKRSKHDVDGRKDESKMRTVSRGLVFRARSCLGQDSRH